MREKIALILAVVMLAALLVPVNTFAAGDTGMEDAIRLVKSKVEIPDNYTKFDYNVSTRGDAKVWYLTWRDKENNGSISAQVDDNGMITSYSAYKPEGPQKNKFPKISREEARSLAEQFIEKMNEGTLKQVSLQENTASSVMGDYNFYYYRVVNGIPFYGNSINISINRNTGEVTSFYINWISNVEFPDSSKAISMTDAMKAYMDKLGLRLTYNSAYDDEQMKIFAAYTVKYSDNYCIDALTGEKVSLSSYYTGGYGLNDQMSYSKAKMDSRSGADMVTITPEELKAIEEVSKLITSEQAQAKARELPILELDDTYKCTQANLYRDWMNKQEFTWQLSFATEAKSKDETVKYVSASLDAVTGEIKSFSTNSYSSDEQPKYDEAAAKLAVQNFLKDFKPEKFSSVEEDTDAYSYPIPYYKSEPQKQFSFRYIRKVNGAYYPGNYLTATYDAVNGKIVSFGMTWYNGQFPSLENILPIDTVYQKLFDEIGLELQYRQDYSGVEQKIIYNPNYNKPQIRLVYSLKPNKPVIFDPFNGSILDYKGDPYKEPKPIKYNDIKGHYAEKQITMLGEYGIGLDGDSFKPEEKITQKDLFKLIVKAFGFYYNEDIISDKQVDEMYNNLIRQGVVRSGEKAPDSNVSREDAVKFMIRSLKYDSVADIKGIYICPFSDVQSINPDLVGYVAIASGLKLVNGYNGEFLPKADLTRAQAALLIYNHFQN